MGAIDGQKALIDTHTNVSRVLGRGCLVVVIDAVFVPGVVRFEAVGGLMARTLTY